MKNLVIVESPTKARTIGRFLGDDYKVIASMGHIYDLPKSKLGVDVENKFDPEYVLIESKKNIIDDLKKESKKAERIIMATDLDREGEAIAFHIAKNLDKKNIDRIIFHEITQEAIDEALSNPKKINEDLVDAQTARRVLDRLVGYKLSPILWQKVRRGLSAGRVQSVALRLIVEREREIEKFKKEPFYTISVELARGPVSLHPRPTSSSASQTAGARRGPSTPVKQANSFVRSPALTTPLTTIFELIKIKGENIEETRKIELYDGEYKYTLTSITTGERAKEIEDDLKSKNFVVSDVSKKEIRRIPPPPYTTSTLQQDGARRMGLSGRRTMQLAQKLYEEGYITYHRTDSVSISQSARKQMSEYVKKEFGEKYLSPKERFYKTVSKTAQEAHEAIRPARVGVGSSEIGSRLGGQFAKLYEMIWRRAVATQMADALIESTNVTVDVSDSVYTLRTKGSVLLFEGFLKINPYALEDKRLPEFIANEHLNFVSSSFEEHETLPPPRYNDASIIKTLEEKGIGRPSTYATIISTIEGRAYIERVENRFKPTYVGLAVNDFLVKNFEDIDDIPFTAEMEDELDLIADGKKQWEPVIADFYKPFEVTLDKVKDAKRVKIETEKTGEKCPECGQGDVVIRTVRFGKFLSCSRFPDCKFTKPYVEKINMKCPKDGGDVVIKKTRKGRRFYGCSNYPACDFAAWRLADIKKEQESVP
ncbi:MAG: DNA topoisomerase I [Candidatus Levybacteria bacterium RIFCSPLOWO2_01_FULL_39_10]|nr:MAG: DNA topoisomerase I [Candidatus Levybacteria bacterium RIFCSPLOWO2_01_FULL_39_10]